MGVVPRRDTKAVHLHRLCSVASAKLIFWASLRAKLEWRAVGEMPTGSSCVLLVPLTGTELSINTYSIYQELVQLWFRPWGEIFATNKVYDPGMFSHSYHFSVFSWAFFYLCSFLQNWRRTDDLCQEKLNDPCVCLFVDGFPFLFCASEMQYQSFWRAHISWFCEDSSVPYISLNETPSMNQKLPGSARERRKRIFLADPG